MSSDACLYCGKRGHWKRDCHQRQRDQANKVQCVEDAAQAPVVSVSCIILWTMDAIGVI